MKKGILFTAAIFFFMGNTVFSADITALKKQCDQSISLASKQPDHNKERLTQARDIYSRTKTKTPPVTELDLKRCIYYAYDSSPSLTNPPGYELEPSGADVPPPFKYPFPAFSSSELHPSWRTEMLTRSAALCTQAVQALSGEKSGANFSIRTAMEGEKRQGDQISLAGLNGADLIQRQKQKIVRYIKCYSKAFKTINKTEQFDLKTMNNSMSSKYNILKEKEKKAKINKNPILYVSEKIYEAAMDASSEVALNPDSVVDIFMATEMLIDPDYIAVCASSAPAMDPHRLPSKLQRFLEEISRRVSKEYFSENCPARNDHPAASFSQESGKATVFIKNLAALTTCAGTELGDLYRSAKNNFLDKSTWSRWDEQKRLAYHAFLWGRQMVAAPEETKGLYAFSEMLMRFGNMQEDNIKSLYKSNGRIFAQQRPSA